MLIIRGFVRFPLVSIKSLNAGIVVFNSAAMVFTILPVVIPAIRKRPLPSQAPVGLFLFFIFLGFGCYYWLWMYKIFANSPLCAITFSVILAAIPLLILVFTSITVSPETISSICEQIKRGFEAKIHLIEDNISNFNEKTKAVDVAYKQLKEAQEKLLEKKQP
ncbi:MAG: hypothetical protein IPF81_07880 [Bacteroidetes bacterium]|nr:hypothetical protein [Bacteroidota bacterium]